MSIKDQLTQDMKQAMKDREAGKLRLSVIRMVRSSIKNIEINDKKELNDDEVLSVLMKEVKMRQDSLEEFQKAGREELVAQAKEEIAILKAYLPEALSDEELKAIVAEVIASVGATSLKEMGKVMPVVMAKTKGRADGKRINAIVRELLK
ncbi:MAG: GatB/YqeY domain-containing protein [Phascolarctobacterium sp.]|nr:GatB/YqeY domain-containing protein [Phascolarctobacterium sp.]